MRLAGSTVANLYTRLNVLVYRASKGRMWGHLYVPDSHTLMPILLLETRGRVTGRRRVTPLIYVKKDGGFLLAAANAGHSRHPGWFLNLSAEPRVRFSLGAGWSAAHGVSLSSPAREASFELFAASYPPLVRYQRATSRAIPMVLLEPLQELSALPNADRRH